MRQWIREPVGFPFVAEHYKSVMKQFNASRVLMKVEIMNTATLHIRWNDRAEEQALPISQRGKISFAGLGVGPGERHCPECDSIVYSRRHRLCGACGHLLPAACLFTPVEAENVEILLKTERQRHRAWLKKTSAL